MTNLIEAADLFWQDLVLQYDLERQFKLANQLEQTRFGTRTRSAMGFFESIQETAAAAALWLKANFVILAGLSVIGLLGWTVVPRIGRRWRERRQRSRLTGGRADANDATLLYRQLLETLEQNQIRKPGWFTPMEFAEKLPASELSARVAEFTRAYNRLRYGNDAAAAGEMLAIYDRIRGAG